MFHQVDTVFNATSSKPIPGALVQVYDASSVIAPLFADQSGTPIESVSGVANTAVTDGDGVYDFWVADGTYDLRFFVGQSMVRSIQKIALDGSASTAVAAKANASALGVLATDSNLGTFAGDTIPPDQTAKQALQALETAHETAVSDLASTATGKGAALIRTTSGDTLQDVADGKLPFTHAATYAQGTVGDHLKRFIVITDAPYNAKGDGSADDTAAIQAAVDAVGAGGNGGMLWIPGGTFNVTSEITISNPIRIVGSGLISRIRTTSATANVFKISATAFEPGVEIEHLYFLSSVTRTAGSYIETDGTNGTKVRNCLFDGAYDGIAITGSVAQGILITGNFFFGTRNICINVDASTGDQGIVTSRIFDNDFFGASDASQTPVAIFVSCCGDLLIQSNRSLYCATALSVSPPAGKTVQLLESYDNTWDSGDGDGISISPDGGTIHVFKSIRDWIATFDLNGVKLAGTGSIGTICITDPEIGNCGQNGINASVTIVTELKIKNGEIGGNGSSGVNIVANLSKFQIIGCTFGTTGQFGDNGAWDVLINGGASDHYIVTINFFTTGGTGAFSDGGSGTNKVVSGNIVVP